ncbi:hypothetical protein BDV93DRAFT_251362 [Ceratobasidium sp. AG-I]|nr:hypothetical protein BDV93DRAFT_251362 [Ceratobasidium sp. AG-I]
MNLSQHLFDIQFARYIQHTTEGHYTTRDASLNAEPNPELRPQRPRAPVDPASHTESPAPQADDRMDEPVLGSEQEGDTLPHGPLLGSSYTAPRAASFSEDTLGVVEQLKVNQDHADQRLAALQDALENNTRIMIKLHNHTARSLSCTKQYGSYHHIINDNGDAPASCHERLSGHGYTYGYWYSAPESDLAQSLQFYNVGLDLVEPGDTPTLKPNSIDQARGILAQHVHSGAA